jgi:tRNA uridine 5-carbamoylmethylation protein Kti12
MIVVCGPPRSGKTTLAHHLTAYLRNLGYNVSVNSVEPQVCDQNLRFATLRTVPITVKEIHYSGTEKHNAYRRHS